jgi:4-hydroxyphenylpyruvate dioxygenase
VDWYGQLFGLRPRQSFHIQTAYSGLRSQVLVGEPVGLDGANRLQLPINEPESATSQIQDFLNHNQGPGIQHIALLTPELLPTVARLRRQEINFLNVPSSYYDQLSQRPKFDAQGLGEDWLEIATQQVLVDWHLDRLEGPLLQIFTQPVFAQPTFFFELIERRKRWLCQLELRAWESEAAAAEVVEAKDMRGVGLTGLAEGMLPLSPSQGSANAALDERSQSGCAEGFGEGNFQALFEAIEREQRSRERVKDC